MTSTAQVNGSKSTIVPGPKIWHEYCSPAYTDAASVFFGLFLHKPQIRNHAASQVHKIGSTEGGLAELCVPLILYLDTHKHTRSVYQVQSLISHVLFFFSALVTECVSSFHSAWSSIIFNRPASECRTFPKIPYLHSDVIGLCGTVFNIGALCIQSGGGVLLLWV